MSKEEQFEHIENKIKQAIQNNQPVFDENAWDKMEALLDKDEKKPRPFYWVWFLLPLLLIGAGSAYFYNYKKNHKNLAQNLAKISTQDSSRSEVISSTNIAESTPQLPAKQNGEESLANSREKQELIIQDVSAQKSNQQIKKVTTGSQLKMVTSKNASLRKNIFTTDAESIENSEVFNIKEKKLVIDKAKIKIKTSGDLPIEGTVTIEKEEADKNLPVEIKKNDGDSSKTLVEKNKREADIAINKNKKDTPAKERIKSVGIYLLGSLGADIGSVKLFSFNNSSASARYGIGIGYQLNNKWSLQTGFYAGKKKYVAGPNDYHTKKPLPPSIKIISVNANCLVYEIPLSLRYNISDKSSILYYTTIGLSSYLMKNEHYGIYRTIYNNPDDYDTAFIGNKHLFSTLTFSAGVEKKISKSFSLLIEPLISIPLKGVGQGKVKLYSTAIMLGIKYFPFKE